MAVRGSTRPVRCASCHCSCNVTLQCVSSGLHYVCRIVQWRLLHSSMPFFFSRRGVGRVSESSSRSFCFVVFPCLKWSKVGGTIFAHVSCALRFPHSTLDVANWQRVDRVTRVSLRLPRFFPSGKRGAAKTVKVKDSNDQVHVEVSSVCCRK